MRHLRAQTGSALIAAMLLMSMMLGVGLAALALVDGEQVRSAGERQREASFNLTEQLLEAQVYKLSRDWPGKGGVEAGTIQAYPPLCTAGVASDRCPDGGGRVGDFGGPDLAVGATWSTMVRDNNSPNVNYYDDVQTRESQPAYDANDDGKVWARAQSTVRGKRRTMAALVKVEEMVEDFPRSVLIAGKFATTNSGRKLIVGTKGTPLHVRCPTRTPDCLDYAANKGQVEPDTTSPGYAGGDAMTDEQIGRLRARAIAEGTYYQSCPARPDGELVFVEQGSCAWANEVAPCCNSVELPGVLIVNRGSVYLGGNIVFHGLVYMPNRDRSAGWVVQVNGFAEIHGAVAIDGPGGMLIGSSGGNLTFNVNVFNRLISYPSAGIVQNTWREIAGAP